MSAEGTSSDHYGMARMVKSMGLQSSEVLEQLPDEQECFLRNRAEFGPAYYTRLPVFEKFGERGNGQASYQDRKEAVSSLYELGEAANYGKYLMQANDAKSDGAEHGRFDRPENARFDRPEHGRFDVPENARFGGPEHGRFDRPENARFDRPEHGRFDHPEN